VNHFEEYRTELNQLRLTDESKQTLLRAITSPGASHRPRVRRRWRRTALSAAVLCAAVTAAGAAQVAAPILQRYYQNSIVYQQNSAVLGQSQTKDGWTVTLTDCVGGRLQHIYWNRGGGPGGNQAGLGGGLCVG